MMKNLTAQLGILDSPHMPTPASLPKYLKRTLCILSHMVKEQIDRVARDNE
jgi:hypothetical protein